MPSNNKALRWLHGGIRGCVAVKRELNSGVVEQQLPRLLEGRGRTAFAPVLRKDTAFLFRNQEPKRGLL